MGSTSVVPILVVWAARELAPRSFSVGDDGVRFERRAGPVRLPLATVRDVRELGPGVRFTRVGGGSPARFVEEIERRRGRRPP